MELLRKTAAITALTYGLYGLISYLSLGVFIPPFPLKPILFAVLLGVFIITLKKEEWGSLSVLLLVWLLFSIFQGQYLVGLFLDHSSLEWYVKTIEPYVFLGGGVSFVLVSYLYLKASKHGLIYRFLLPSMLLVAIFVSFISQVDFLYNWVFLAVLLVIYLLNSPWKTDFRNELVEKVQVILSSVFIIVLLENISLLLGN